MENYQLGRTVLDMIDAHPERLDMNHYGCGDWTPGTEPCGATACLVGHTLIASGYRMRLDHYGHTRFFRPDGSAVGWLAKEAAGLLGMTDNEEWCFFFPIEGPAEFREQVGAAEMAAADQGEL